MKAEQLDHVLSEWLQRGADNPIHRAIAWGGHTETTHRIADLVRTPNLVKGLKYLDPDDGSTERDLEASDKKDLIAAISFSNTLQNEFGPKQDVGVVDLTKFDQEQYVEYIDGGEYDPNNPTVYDITAARESLEFHKEMGKIKGHQPTKSTAGDSTDSTT